jgi:hypothetical protein
MSGTTLASSFRRRRTQRILPTRILGLYLLCLGAEALAAYSLVAGHTAVAVAIAALPLAIWESTRLAAALVLLGVGLPFFWNVAGGSSANVAVSDLLLVFIGAVLCVRAAALRTTTEFRALRPVAFPVIQYGGFLLVLLLIHPGARELLQTGQRAELFLLPLLVGAFAGLTDRYVPMLKAYAVAAALLAVIWPLDHLSLQKNPVGQFIANGILLLIALPRLRAFAPLLLVLIPGLFLSASRGAVGSVFVGLAVIAFMHESRGRALLTRVIPTLAVAVAAFALVPAAVSQRLTTTSSGNLGTTAQYSIHIHQQYAHDAHRLIRLHKWTGIGIGNYLAGDAYLGTQTTDPHNVFLLQEAEGGYGFAISFGLLLAGISLVLYRMRRLHLASAALAVLLATAAHGVVDVYWVRATPVLGWLLVGAVCGAYARKPISGQPQ